MAYDPWPLRDLRLRTPDLLLRPLTEADLPELTETMSADVGVDPSLPTWPELGPVARRAASVHQGYWRALAQWTPQSWALTFAVLAGGRLVGAQTVEADQFLIRRTVDSASHLVPDVRGRGWGKQMRRAVLALAFGPMGARLAVTSAWHHNAASLGVSRSLGYIDNGVTLDPREDGRGADTMVHLRLERADWLASGQAAEVAVEGFEGCRRYFGL